MLKSSTANLLMSIENICKHNDIDTKIVYDEINLKLYGIIQELEDRGFKE